MRTLLVSLLPLVAGVIACSGGPDATSSTGSASTAQDCTNARNAVNDDNKVVGQLCHDAQGAYGPGPGATGACLGALATAVAATANASRVCGAVFPPPPKAPGPPCSTGKDCTAQVGAGSVCKAGSCSAAQTMCKTRHAHGYEFVERCGASDDAGADGGEEGGGSEGGADDGGVTSEGGNVDGGG